MNPISFSYSKEIDRLHGSLIYRESEYSFDFSSSSEEQLKSRIGSRGCMSVGVSTLQIEVGVETGRLLYPWGFFPLLDVGYERVILPNIVPGGVFVKLSRSELKQGVSFDIPNSEHWRVTHDIDSGWVHIGQSRNFCRQSTYIEFADNSVVGIFKGEINCILIRPDFQT